MLQFLLVPVHYMKYEVTRNIAYPQKGMYEE